MDRECIVLHPFFTSSHGVSKQSAHRFGSFGLGERCDVGVCVEREARGVVTEHPGDRFDVHAVLQSQGCKCVPLRYNKDKREKPVFSRFQDFFCTCWIKPTGSKQD